MRQLFEFKTADTANLICETVASADGKGKDIVMSGIFIQADIKNQNQRVYPLDEINRAVVSINEQIKNGYSVLGELDHPEELSINLDRVSHMITNMWMEGNNGCGKLKLLHTPMGEIAKSLLESGVKLGVSSRGSGNVSPMGEVSEFDMVTVDIVAQPSAPSAYPKKIYESLFNMRGGQQVFETAKGLSQGDLSAARYLEKDIVKFIKDLKIK